MECEALIYNERLHCFDINFCYRLIFCGEMSPETDHLGLFSSLFYSISYIFFLFSYIIFQKSCIYSFRNLSLQQWNTNYGRFLYSSYSLLTLSPICINDSMEVSVQQLVQFFEKKNTSFSIAWISFQNKCGRNIFSLKFSARQFNQIFFRQLPAKEKKRAEEKEFIAAEKSPNFVSIVSAAITYAQRLLGLSHTKRRKGVILT